LLSWFSLVSDWQLLPANSLLDNKVSDKVKSFGFASNVGIGPGILRDARGIDGVFEASGAFDKDGKVKPATHVEIGPCSIERMLSAQVLDP
jgi:hypothetical protein